MQTQIKAILDAKVVNEYIELHKKLKIPFTLTMTTYTVKIVSNYCNIHFMKSEQPMQVFTAYNKVKRDVTQYDIKKVNVNNLQYFSQNFQSDNFYSDIIYNVDIKSAYATILFNDGMISKETFEYLKKIPKMQRLAAVGMLAGKKNIFEMDADGEVITERTERSPTSDYFFYCVKRTAELVNTAAYHLGAAFLFSWVDGIYYLEEHESSKRAGKILKEYFADNKLESSFDVLREFEVTGKPDHYLCEYIKNDKKTFMNVPKTDNKTIKKITDYLITKNYN